ncbi:hypothetical protein AKJ41_01620 [candidate division MSBL1 archaeon SCGC-AAA259O05]|uniref:Uncharacterized protein n=1 Tax=candidate division MSBL1 archaeon SCGC-AAA259O05 TaxID=1698271 RepID=A0A133V4P0_9EURY|nr:hypothetical protein AKJ41_01620 [candidate division MSBL1 archaeon SCGC-AAA259O05]
MSPKADTDKLRKIGRWDLTDPYTIAKDHPHTSDYYGQQFNSIQKHALEKVEKKIRGGNRKALDKSPNLPRSVEVSTDALPNSKNFGSQKSQMNLTSCQN